MASDNVNVVGCECGVAVVAAECDYHLTLLAHQAADMFPLAMFLACRVLKSVFLWVPSGDPVTPCCPNLISFVWLPFLARTACDFVGWFGVFFGLL